MTTTPSQQEPLSPEHQELLTQLNGDKGMLETFLKELDEQDKELAAAAQPPARPATTPSRELARPKASQPAPPAQAEEPAQEEPPTREHLAGVYGEAIVGAAETAGLDLWAWEQAARKGEDTSALRQSLADATGIPVSLIEQYERSARPPAAEEQPPAEAEQQAGEAHPGSLTETEVAGLVAIPGDRAAFERLATWAEQRLKGDPLLLDYNTAIGEGNALAARVALRTMVQLQRQEQGHEPTLLEGQGAIRPEVDVFRTAEELMEAMHSDYKNGKSRYHRDPAYRTAVDAKLARSGTLL